MVAVHVLGQPHRRADQNDGRARLLGWVTSFLAVADWGRIDAVLLPAGFFTVELALGPMHAADRHAAIDGSEIAFVCRSAAAKLATCIGGKLIVGVDTRPYAKRFKGDQLMVAWEGDAIVGSARKFFPSPLELGRRGRAYPLFERDFGDAERFLTLGSGHAAVMCVCYDAFAFSERELGPTWKTANLRLSEAGRSPRDEASTPSPQELFDRFGQAVTARTPTVALVAIHGFEQPGRETRWQRHGIATASAGLGGALVVGAAHFRWWLPDEEASDHSTLASLGVGRRHLHEGLTRRARKLPSRRAGFVEVPGSPHLAAVLRLFEG